MAFLFRPRDFLFLMAASGGFVNQVYTTPDVMDGMKGYSFDSYPYHPFSFSFPDLPQ